MEHRFNVSGMTCGHCEKAVTRALMRLDPNAEVSIDRPAGRVTVRSSQPWEGLAQVITGEGYGVMPVQPGV